MSSRAVLLGTGAFPFIIRLWLEMFKGWQDEVDVVYMAVDHYSEPSTREYIQNLVKEFPKVKLLDKDIRGWPDSYTDAYKASKEDQFLIMHDDTFVHAKGIVDYYFNVIEKGVVAVPFQEIYSPADVVNPILQEKYPWMRPPFSFLLYFLFISRANLEKTSLNFNGVGWNKGEYIPPLGIKAPQNIAGDTGFLTILELLSAEVKFYEIERSETAGYRFDENIIIKLVNDWRFHNSIFEGRGWFHLQNTGNTIPLWFNEDLDAREWNGELEGIRLAWLWEMMQTEDFAEIPEFKKRGEEVFKGVALRCGLDVEKIKTVSNIFHILLYG